MGFCESSVDLYGSSVESNDPSAPGYGSSGDFYKPLVGFREPSAAIHGSSATVRESSAAFCGLSATRRKLFLPQSSRAIYRTISFLIFVPTKSYFSVSSVISVANFSSSFLRYLLFNLFSSVFFWILDSEFFFFLTTHNSFRHCLPNHYIERLQSECVHPTGFESDSRLIFVVFPGALQFIFLRGAFG